MSNAELQIQFKGARQRMDGLYTFGMWLAWHVAALSRIPADKPLPKLETLLAGMNKRKQKPMTKAQQKALFQQTADRFGLKVRRVPKKKVNG